MDSQTLELEIWIENTLCRNMELKLNNELCTYVSPNFKIGDPHSFNVEFVVN
jgi:hypothetical protein